MSAALPSADAPAEPRDPPGAPLPKGWAPPPYPVRAPMEGRYCRLEPLTVGLAEALHAANAEDRDGRIWRYLPYGPFESPEAYAAWVGEVTRHPDPLFFAILVQGRPVGVASYLRIAPEAGSIEVGHLNFAPALQRSPAATEAMFLMMQWAFEAGYRRYEWKCNALNVPSRRAAMRLGMSYEGVFRQASVAKGRNRDTAWYAAIDAEWPALKAAFEAWLDPQNFDGNGMQRQALRALTQPILVMEG
ncbi:MAG: GNAT family protein [Pseudomonadota bacterium]